MPYNKTISLSDRGKKAADFLIEQKCSNLSKVCEEAIITKAVQLGWHESEN